MKLRQQPMAIRHELDLNNHGRLVTKKKEVLANSTFYPLLRVLAEVLDSAGRGEGAWISFGCNQAGDAYLLTVHQGRDKMYAGGASLEDLSTDCQNLLEATEMP